MKKFYLAFFVLSLVVASAKTYKVTLFQAITLGGTVLKPGDYKVEVGKSIVVLSNRGQKAESAVTVETNTTKYKTTTIRYRGSEGGNMRPLEMRLGGTTIKLVFN